MSGSALNAMPRFARDRPCGFACGNFREKKMVSRINAFPATLALALALSFFASPAMAAGALAIDSNQGKQYGWAQGHKSISQAEQRALGECGSGCQIVLRFESGCAAYAADQSRQSTAYGWATAGTSAAAQDRALSECRARRGTSCIVRAWGCN